MSETEQPLLELESSKTLGALAAALAKVQGALSNVHATRTAKVPTKSGGEYEYDYADLASVLDAVRAPLASNGLALVQMPSTTDRGILITTLLLHTSGEFLQGRLLMPVGTWTPQVVGTAISYGRRYAIAPMLGIATEKDDDAAEASKGAAPAPAPQQRPTGNLPTTFPKFGKQAGQPIQGASEKDLRFYIGAAKRSLADAGKAKWHNTERANLAAYEAEIVRQGGGKPEDDYGPPPPGDDDAPF